MHSNVAVSYPEDGLSHVSLAWLIGEAEAAGLMGALIRKLVGVAGGGSLTFIIVLVGGLAATVWQAGVARREASKAGEVKDFLISLFQGADPERLGIQWPGSRGPLFAQRYREAVHAREPYTAYTHMATAGGVLASLALVALNYGLALYWPSLDLAILAATLVMLIGAGFVWWRRRKPLARLSRGAWDRLPYTLAAFAAGLALVVALPPASLSAGIAAIALILLLVGSAELALGIGLGGPMKHAVAGLLHLAFHPRPERFAGVPPTALKPLDPGQRVLGLPKEPAPP